MRGKSEVRNQRSEVRNQNALSSDLRSLTSDFLPRSGFTLTELLVVMMILGIMAGLALSGMAGAIDLAKEQRTRAIIAKLDQLIMERYEGYRTRSVPISAAGRQGTYLTPRQGAQNRLFGLRAMMRMELPDRRTDVVNFQTMSLEIPGQAQAGGINLSLLGMQQAALQKTYFRMALRATGGNLAKWTMEHEGSECLYLIVSTMHDGDKNALDYFLPGEIGDTDQDGMKEILDGWGQPIEFLRWAPGYLPNGNYPVSTMQVNNFLLAPDQFDPAKVDPRYADDTVVSGVTTDTKNNNPYMLHPLIYSAGRDRKYDIFAALFDTNNRADPEQSFRSAFPPVASPSPPINTPNDPWFNPTFTTSMQGQMPAGTPGDADKDGYYGYADNITNHYQVTP